MAHQGLDEADRPSWERIYSALTEESTDEAKMSL